MNLLFMYSEDVKHEKSIEKTKSTKTGKPKTFNFLSNQDEFFTCRQCLKF